MAKYTISSTVSGEHLGTYEAASPEEALEQLCRDAGYASAAEAAEVTGDDGAHLVVRADVPRRGVRFGGVRRVCDWG